jgi:hypothetical protein
MDQEKNILFITSSFPRWENDSTTPFMLDLAVGLQEHGWKVDVMKRIFFS